MGVLWPPERERRYERAMEAREPEEVWVDWDRWMDGRLWRLQRDRDFRGTVADVRAAAVEVARQRGKAVRTSDDRIFRYTIVWVQFADAEVPLGDPCPCGHLVLRRLHDFFARCEACGARLILTPPPTSAALAKAKAKEAKAKEKFNGDAAAADEPQPTEDDTESGSVEASAVEETPADEPAAPAPEDTTPDEAAVDAPRSKKQSPPPQRPPHPRLEAFTDVFLERYDSSPNRERLRGYGRDEEGKLVLLLVDYPLEDGERIPDPHAPDSHVHRVVAWPVEPFGNAIDISAFDR